MSCPHTAPAGDQVSAAAPGAGRRPFSCALAPHTEVLTRSKHSPIVLCCANSHVATNAAHLGYAAVQESVDAVRRRRRRRVRARRQESGRPGVRLDTRRAGRQILAQGRGGTTWRVRVAPRFPSPRDACRRARGMVFPSGAIQVCGHRRTQGRGTQGYARPQLFTVSWAKALCGPVFELTNRGRAGPAARSPVIHELQSRSDRSASTRPPRRQSRPPACQAASRRTAALHSAWRISTHRSAIPAPRARPSPAPRTAFCPLAAAGCRGPRFHPSLPRLAHRVPRAHTHARPDCDSSV
jgi:hypothetical protein